MLIKIPELGTLADLATHRLAQSIVSGELAQGQKLNEVELAERFGMGRGPLREALRHLEGMRLVKRIPNAGARVVVLDKKHSLIYMPCGKRWKAWRVGLPQR